MFTPTPRKILILFLTINAVVLLVSAYVVAFTGVITSVAPFPYWYTIGLFMIVAVARVAYIVHMFRKHPVLKDVLLHG